MFHRFLCELLAHGNKIRKQNKKTFGVRKSMHHHTIQIIQPTRCKNFTSLLLDFYVWLNMFRASPLPSSGANNCTRSLWFYRWREPAEALLVVVWQTTTNDASCWLNYLNRRKRSFARPWVFGAFPKQN